MAVALAVVVLNTAPYSFGDNQVTVTWIMTSEAAAASTEDSDDKFLSFDEWTKIHRIAYENAAEHVHRRGVYEQNLERWHELNHIPGAARFGPQREPFADLSPKEYDALLQGKNVMDDNLLGNTIKDRWQWYTECQVVTTTNEDKYIHHHHLGASYINYLVDWRHRQGQSYVTPVKNQGKFGTCWSFAVAENLEALTVRQGYQLVNISEQEFISCCPHCAGRMADVSLAWLINATGGRPALEVGYPYVGNKSACLDDTAPRAPVTLHSFGRLADPDGTGRAIVRGLGQRGPMGMGIAAGCFQ
eukprot:scaffold6596_cov161-Amphora_coffeaeformis.AAC.20